MLIEFVSAAVGQVGAVLLNHGIYGGKADDAKTNLEGGGPD